MYETTSGFELTDEQVGGVQNILDWFYEAQDPFFTLGGYAGTGKSTVTGELTEYLEDKGSTVKVCAPTGKAANVLRKKGLSQATTVHATIYNPGDPDDSDSEWVLRPSLNCDLLIVDE